MTRALRVLAGPTAFQHIVNHGLQQEHISAMVGASGGPKWLSFAKLDEYLFGEFFASRREPLPVVGSSAGAWRFACLAQEDPAQASRDFAHAYQHICYPKGMTVKEITTHTRQLLDVIFSRPNSEAYAANNPVFKLHVVAARAKHLNQSSIRAVQALGLGATAAANALSRRFLGSCFERVVFQPEGFSPFQWPTLPTQIAPLTAENIRQAIAASGAIPLVLEGVKDIAGATPGMYYDGGITDYHFDIPFAREGIVLYPHFYSHITPGWFDKAIKWRKPNPQHFHNVVLLCPNEAWLAKQPLQRIPDRHDFVNMKDKERIAAWGESMARSAQLVEEFMRFCEGDLSALEEITTWR